MGMVWMTLARPEVARATFNYHICLFRALEKPKKAEIGYVSEVGHGEGDGHGGDDPRQAGGGQGHIRAPQVPLLGLGEAPEC